MSDILPDSRAKDPRGRVIVGSQVWVPIFCANCGRPGGMCPEENMTFLFYQCEPCARTYGALAATMAMPDEVFWETVKQAQIEKYDRVPSPEEVATALADPLSLESLLARNRDALTPKAGT